jgi:small-conductance mechanosensitive channel
LIIIGAILVFYILARRIITRLVHRIGKERNVAENRIDYVNATLKVSLAIVSVVAIGMVIGIDQKDLGLFFGSVIALLGVALFAQWSILSNLTASVIVFFFFPYRVGDFICILDSENSIAGQIKEISLFHVILIDENDVIITFPNSMVFQKAVKITTKIMTKERLEEIKKDE